MVIRNAKQYAAFQKEMVELYKQDPLTKKQNSRLIFLSDACLAYENAQASNGYTEEPYEDENDE
jgi:hypothetical protein